MDAGSSSSSFSAPAQHQRSPLLADLPAHAPALAPAGGRAGKRRSRASKRAPTTYITTDPANFRIMVQQITGVQAEPVSPADGILQPTTPFEASALHQQLQQQPCFPTLDSWNVMYGRDVLL